MTLLTFAIARFTYVRDEHYDTVEEAFAAKSQAEWAALIPHSNLSLTIDKSFDQMVVMKCQDGHDVRVSRLLFCVNSRICGISLRLKENAMEILQGVLSSSSFLILSFAGTNG
jgi:hypothetical protein